MPPTRVIEKLKAEASHPLAAEVTNHAAQYQTLENPNHCAFMCSTGYTTPSHQGLVDNGTSYGPLFEWTRINHPHTPIWVVMEKPS